MSRSNIAGGKNSYKAVLFVPNVAITLDLVREHPTASPSEDDGKSLSLIAFALVIPYRKNIHIIYEFGESCGIGPRTSVKLSVFDHREVMTFNGEVDLYIRILAHGIVAVAAGGGRSSKNGLIVHGINVHTLIVLFYVVVRSVYSWGIAMVWCKCSEFKVGNTVLYVRCKVASGEVVVKSAVMMSV
ncbi:hypothetical protein Tco_0724672 [Tanacetum coccineum]